MREGREKGWQQKGGRTNLKIIHLRVHFVTWTDSSAIQYPNCIRRNDTSLRSNLYKNDKICPTFEKHMPLEFELWWIRIWSWLGWHSYRFTNEKTTTCQNKLFFFYVFRETFNSWMPWDEIDFFYLIKKKKRFDTRRVKNCI